MLQLRKWMPLILLTVAGFTFNTSELTPIGLLSDIACDFSISESRAGLLISVYAWVVALLSLPLMLYCARMDFRKLLLSIVALFFVSHIGSFLATGFWTLMASRIGVACAHSLFWSIAPPMAVAVTADGRRATALWARVGLLPLRAPSWREEASRLWPDCLSAACSGLLPGGASHSVRSAYFRPLSFSDCYASFPQFRVRERMNHAWIC